MKACHEKNGVVCQSRQDYSSFGDAKRAITLLRRTILVKNKYVQCSTRGKINAGCAFLVQELSFCCAMAAHYRCIPQRRIVSVSAVWKTMFSTNKPMMTTMARPANTFSV
jgi:hypothetical protein